MYTIAVCDDERAAARHIAASVQGRFQARNHPAEVDQYTDAEELERRLADGTHYDILLLDIDMPGLDGIELCRRFRARSGDALVVFISNKEDLVFQTFDVQPFRFIRKNFFSEEIDKLCLDLMGEMDRRSDKWLRFEDQQGTIHAVNIRKLLYAEAAGKLCRLVTAESEEEIRYRFNDLAELLKKDSFIQIHRSYMANPYYIFRIDKETVLLDNGTVLPLSRRRRDEIKDLFFEWSRGVR